MFAGVAHLSFYRDLSIWFVVRVRRDKKALKQRCLDWELRSCASLWNSMGPPVSMRCQYRWTPWL